MSSEITISSLSDKCLFEIFTHLDYESFLNASSVCLRWNKLVEENIDFFSSFFAGEGEDEEENEVSGQKRKADEISAEDIQAEQAMIVNQINSTNPHQFFELLGVAEDADEDEIRGQYKKMALMVHPDKNKQPGADKAFQTLKRAFDAIMSGVDPESPDTAKVECPDPNCGATVYLHKDKCTSILKGMDIGACKVCKQKFGRVFCLHCFSAWTMVLNPELAGTIAQCSVCNRQFAIQFPKPAPAKPKQPNDTKKRVVKRKKNWWEAPGK
jgi:hypothetical protein